ncbi:hypothetical protein SELMODRAFT_426148 [Selaginella moellendorffii]|uniref:J domain-containing protein n=1 Tax=Selaginella moellendorffii TaxID=88036 RepID=D8SVG9_SELML|nr:hypothetical protein SELMODRAFT_426148 [Selaginella moellendorffii]
MEKGRGKADGSTRCLYKILGVEYVASTKEIRKAYIKHTLELHPNKNPEDRDTMKKLHDAFVILGDPQKRALYDAMGCVESGDCRASPYDCCRRRNERVTLGDIESFCEHYRGSEAEVKDLKGLYMKYGGNMDKVFANLMCSEPREDSRRFMEVLGTAISSGNHTFNPKAYFLGLN